MLWSDVEISQVTHFIITVNNNPPTNRYMQSVQFNLSCQLSLICILSFCLMFLAIRPVDDLLLHIIWRMLLSHFQSQHFSNAVVAFKILNRLGNSHVVL